MAAACAWPKDVAPFRPARWCRGAHAQTICASAPRGVPAPPGMRRERWQTDDADFLDVDHVPAAAGQPILVVLHGLEGSSRAPQVRGLLGAAQRRRWRAVALNFRSCSGEPNRLRRSYHAGETADLDWTIRRLARAYPGDPIVCAGLSLGGNVLLKYLGEQAHAPSPLRAAATVCAPFDLAASARAFEAGAFARLYMRRLVRSLKRKALAKLSRYPDLLDRARLAAVRTIREFDEAVTAPVHGFASAAEYWRSCSCRQLLAAIRRPTLLVNALDDPLVPAATLPYDEVARSAWLRPAFTRAGGHVGFISGGWPGRPVFWAQQAVVDFFAGQLAALPDDAVCLHPTRAALS